MAGNMSLLNPFNVFNQFGAYGAYAQVGHITANASSLLFPPHLVLPFVLVIVIVSILVRNDRHSISPRYKFLVFFFNFPFPFPFPRFSRINNYTNFFDSTYSSKQLWWLRQRHKGRISIQWRHWHTLALANCRTRWTACQTPSFHRLPVRLSFLLLTINLDISYLSFFDRRRAGLITRPKSFFAQIYRGKGRKKGRRTGNYEYYSGSWAKENTLTAARILKEKKKGRWGGEGEYPRNYSK